MSRYVLCLIFATLAVTFVTAGEANVDLSKVANVEKVPQLVEVLHKVKDPKNVKDDENSSSDSDSSDSDDSSDSNNSNDSDDSSDSDDDSNDSDDSKSKNDKKCGPREKWDKCGSLHEEDCCAEKRRIYSKIVCSKKTAGCRCKQGAARDLESGKCIEKKKCRKLCEMKYY